MTDLELIQNLEQHAGFVMNRLTCDGNIYARRIQLKDAYTAYEAMILAFVALRKSLLPDLPPEQVTAETVVSSVNDFNTEDWSD